MRVTLGSPGVDTSASTLPVARAFSICGELGLARVERDIDGIELDQRVQRAGRGADERALGGEIAPQPAGERRADFGVAEIERRGIDRGLIERQRGFGDAHRAGALIERVLGDVAALQQFLAAREIRLRIFERRLRRAGPARAPGRARPAGRADRSCRAGRRPSRRRRRPPAASRCSRKCAPASEMPRIASTRPG